MSQDAAAAPAAEGEAPLPAAEGKSRFIMFVIIGVVLVAGLGAGGWFLWPRFFGDAKPATPPPVVIKATVPLGSVVVNLNGEDRRYLRVGVSLGVADPKHMKELEEHRSQLLDLIISGFSSADVEDLTSEDGKADIKTELVERMHEELHLETVARVYFTEFVIQ